MGKLYIVGIGPGNFGNLTIKAKKVLEKTEVIVGYKKYIELIKPFFPDKEYKNTLMTQEIERCKMALDLAEKKLVSIISSGDSGVYGMTGLVLQLNKNIKIEIIPGITASVSASSLIGAPLTHDNCNISLSDLLTPFDLIKKRILLAAQGDFVISFYNPKSKKRKNYIDEAINIISEYRNLETPITVIKNAYREEQEIILQTFKTFNSEKIDMNSIVIVGNSQSYYKNNFFITPRGYENKEKFQK